MPKSNTSTTASFTTSTNAIGLGAAAGLTKRTALQGVRETIMALQPNKRFVKVKEWIEQEVSLCWPGAASLTGASIPMACGGTAR